MPASGQSHPCRGKAGVQLDRLAEVAEGLLLVLIAAPAQEVPPLQIVVEGFVIRALRGWSRSLCGEQRDFQLRLLQRRNLLLYGKDVVHLPVKRFRPQLSPVRGLD